MMKWIIFSLLFNISTVFAQESSTTFDHAEEFAPLAEWHEARIAFVERPPHMYTMKSGKRAGIIYDILEELSLIEGFDIEYVDCKMNECINLLRASLVDLIPGVTEKDDRLNGLLFSKHTLYSNWGEVYTHARNQISDYTGLNNQKIGVTESLVLSKTAKAYFKANNLNNELIEYTTPDSLLQDIEDKKIDIGIVERFAGGIYGEGKAIRQLPLTVNASELKLVFAPHAPIKVITLFDAQLELLNTPDGIDAISVIQSYMHQPKPPFPVKLLIIALLGAIIAALLYTVNHYRKLSKRSKVKSKATTESLNVALVAGDLGHFEWSTSTGLLKMSKQCSSIFGFNQLSSPRTMSELLAKISIEDNETILSHFEDPTQLDARYYKFNASVENKDKLHWVYLCGKKHTIYSDRFICYVKEISELKDKDEQIAQLNKALKKHIFNND